MSNHFKKYSSIILEFLPQIILLFALFFYLVVMMFIKWLLYSADPGIETKWGTSCAPSVLIYFINMMLFKSAESHKDCEEYMFDFQPTLQMGLVFVALICIPWLLLGKPLYIKFTRGRKPYVRSNGDVNPGLELGEIPDAIPHSGHHGKDDEEEEEPLSEIFIHQAIHTIEYVLSTISHTASYLRLWALSLAHAQLSEVLWNMIFQMGLKFSSYVGVVTIFIFFAIWAGGTIAILVVMEGLSAFLHTLRLHWVEFMSKFYEGLGHPFQPFSFKVIMEQEDSPDAE